MGVYMPISEARKLANRKWDKENMTQIACRLTKKKATLFKEACQEIGIVPNRVLLNAIDRTIEEAEKKRSQG